MPAVLSQKDDKDTLQLRSKVRRRKKGQPQAAFRGSMESDGEGDVRGSGRDLSFRNGEWRERDMLEMAVIATQPRGTEIQDKDDGDSGISETTAVEERLLPSRGGPETSERAPEYGHAVKKETVLETLIQVFIPFMIAGFGMMAAGLLLDKVQVNFTIIREDITQFMSYDFPSLSGSTGTCTYTSMRYLFWCQLYSV